MIFHEFYNFLIIRDFVSTWVNYGYKIQPDSTLFHFPNQCQALTPLAPTPNWERDSQTDGTFKLIPVPLLTKKEEILIGHKYSLYVHP